MKVFQKFLHLSLTVAFLMATMGFRVNLDTCPDGKAGISLGSKSSCCCNKAPEKPQSKPGTCADMTCIVQGGFTAYTSQQTTVSQQTSFIREPVSYVAFRERIQPRLRTKASYYTLPPPLSGRFLGILHQTFLI